MGVQSKDIVVVDYVGTFENGDIFDSSTHGDHSHPLEFQVGAGEVIPGFDRGMIGMEIGEDKEIIIMPKDAYGEIDRDKYKEIPKASFEFEEEPIVGMSLLIGLPDGKEFQTKIVALSEKTVTIDLNHPLAGKKLIFNVKLLEIK